MARNWWAPWLVFLALAVALFLAFPEIRRIFALALQADPRWVVVAAVLLLAHYVVDAVLFKVSFDVVGVRSTVGSLVPVVFASLFANLAGIGASSALLVEEAARRGQPAARATAGVLLQLLLDYITFLLFLGVGLAYLALRGQLLAYQLAGAAALLAFILVLLTALYLGLRRRNDLRRYLEWIRRVVNAVAARFGRPALLAESWARENAASFATAAVAALSLSRRTLGNGGVGIAFHLLEWLGAYALFPAFGQPVAPLEALAGYAVGRLFWIIGITPQGIGVVEGTMALTYISLGVPVTTAGAIALTFRGLDFWLPMLIGVFFLPRLPGFRR
ncbi:MAG TPA: lysylphosphatidylglycerol synthase transmembrane domain-containing protein [Anaerolineae bacterium]|nr:lysylphosphatidylglycerol synthase transmembrane domain-containing protein [Anaerolineae bacterium]